VAAGVLLLGEPFTATMAAAFVLILSGCVLATGGRRRSRTDQDRDRAQDRPVPAPPAPGSDPEPDPDQVPDGRTARM
jgi:hypothetical protein